MVKKVCVTGIIAVLMLVSCTQQEFTVVPPEGFAQFETENPYQFRAISPEGVVFRLKLVLNEPEKDLPFWSKALKNQLDKEGYSLLGESTFESAGIPGSLYEWGAPYGSEDYIYMTGIIISGDKLLVIEAAGPSKHFSKYKDGITASLGTITL